MSNTRSRTYKTTGVILRRSDFGEADRLLTIMTPAYGKIRALAKGVRRPTTRAAGHVELYAESELVLHKGRNFDIITQAELVEPHIGLHSHLSAIAYASLFAELVDRFAVENEGNPDAYALLTSGLGWLCEATTNLPLAARYFELHLLITMGFTPSLFRCAVSGERLEPIDQFYSAEDGGVVSPGFAHQRMIPLPLDVFKILRHFSRNRWQAVQNLKLDATHHAKLEQVLHATIIYHLEQRLQSIAFLRHITH